MRSRGLRSMGGQAFLRCYTRPEMPTTSNPALLEALRRAVGAGNVVHAPEDLIAYEYDATIEHALPDAVVFPGTAEECAAVVRAANQFDVPVIPRGSGTGLAGGTLAVKGGVVVALTRMNRIVEIDAANRIAVVEPGVINLQLQEALAPHRLTWAPDPSSQRICSVGGNIGNNSGGPHTLAQGSTVNHVLGLEVVVADGRVINLGGRVLDAPGVDLRGLMVGSEGTLGIVTQATLRLIPLAPNVRTLLAIFDTIEAASEAVSAVIRNGVIPVAMEMMDQEIIKVVEPRIHAGYPMDAGAVLLIEVEGLPEGVVIEAQAVIDACRASGAREVRSAETQQERDRLWEGRKAGIGAIGAAVPAFYLLDGVVPRTKLPAVMHRVMELVEQYGFRCANIFHAGDGNLHPNIMFDPQEEGATQRVLDLGGEIMRLCVDVGGSITGEHGIGSEKRSYMEWVFSPTDLQAMERVRLAFGSVERFNPCKVLPGGHGCASGHAAEIAAHISKPGVYI
ncbi:MAG: FAD-binding protein [Chloroflexi bacterium]|nr:MAG: FAD-binding protein [Chloroflexota bacterium]